MTDRERLDLRIKNLRTIKLFYSFSVWFFLSSILVSVLLIACWISELKMGSGVNSNSELIWSIICIALCIPIFFFIGALSLKFAVTYKGLLKTLKTTDPTQFETKTLICQKYKHILLPRGKHTAKTCGVCVYTDNGKYYYFLIKGIKEHGALSAVFKIKIGEQEFELYKGTNIIKSFDAVDEVQSEHSLW